MELEYDNPMNCPTSLFAELVYSRDEAVLCFSASLFSSFEMQLAGVLQLCMCLDASLQGAPSKQRT